MIFRRKESRLDDVVFQRAASSDLLNSEEVSIDIVSQFSIVIFWYGKSADVN